MVPEKVSIDDCENFREDRDKIAIARTESSVIVKRIALVILAFALSSGLAALSWGLSNSVSLARTEERVETNSRDIKAMDEKMDALLEGVRQTMREEFAKDRRRE